MSMISPHRVGQLVLLRALSSAISAQEWRFYGGDAGGARSSPLRQINRQRRRKLEKGMGRITSEKPTAWAMGLIGIVLRHLNPRRW